MRTPLSLAATLRTILLATAAGLVACAPAETKGTAMVPTSESFELRGPIAPLARAMPGAWDLVYESGERVTKLVSPGPGGRSIRLFTTGSAAAGGPWRELELVYWHPRLATLRSLGLGCYAEHVAEGTVHIDGDVWSTDIDLYQTRARRTLRLVRTFTGPDSLHALLSEETAPGTYEVLAGWDLFRRATPDIDGAAGPSEAIRSTSRIPAQLVALADRGWSVLRVDEERALGPLDAAFAWIPHADVVDLRFATRGGDRPEDRLVDAVVYRHTGRGTLRALALTAGGGVLEGDVRVAADGAIDCALEGWDERGPARYRVRLEIGTDGGARGRVWSDHAEEPLYEVLLGSAEG